MNFIGRVVLVVALSGISFKAYSQNNAGVLEGSPAQQVTSEDAKTDTSKNDRKPGKRSLLQMLDDKTRDLYNWAIGPKQLLFESNRATPQVKTQVKARTYGTTLVNGHGAPSPLGGLSAWDEPFEAVRQVPPWARRFVGNNLIDLSRPFSSDNPTRIELPDGQGPLPGPILAADENVIYIQGVLGLLRWRRFSGDEKWKARAGRKLFESEYLEEISLNRSVESVVLMGEVAFAVIRGRGIAKLGATTSATEPESVGNNNFARNQVYGFREGLILVESQGIYKKDAVGGLYVFDLAQFAADQLKKGFIPSRAYWKRIASDLPALGPERCMMSKVGDDMRLPIRVIGARENTLLISMGEKGAHTVVAVDLAQGEFVKRTQTLQDEDGILGFDVRKGIVSLLHRDRIVRYDLRVDHNGNTRRPDDFYSTAFRIKEITYHQTNGHIPLMFSGVNMGFIDQESGRLLDKIDLPPMKWRDCRVEMLPDQKQP